MDLWTYRHIDGWTFRETGKRGDLWTHGHMDVWTVLGNRKTGKQGNRETGKEVGRLGGWEVGRRFPGSISQGTSAFYRLNETTCISL